MVLEGPSRSDAGVVAHDQAKAPPQADRAETLALARKELLEVIEKRGLLHERVTVSVTRPDGPVW